jgi:predicted nucleic acid-binding protein
MKIVLDASAAIAAVLGHTSAPAIVEILSGASVVIAPELFVAEVTSALWKYVVAKQVTSPDAAEHLEAALQLVDRYQSLSVLTLEVLREASSRRHSVYDMFYVVLARREGAALLTNDTRLRKLVAEMGISVHP